MMISHAVKITGWKSAMNKLPGSGWTTSVIMNAQMNGTSVTGGTRRGTYPCFIWPRYVCVNMKKKTAEKLIAVTLSFAISRAVSGFDVLKNARSLIAYRPVKKHARRKNRSVHVRNRSR